MNDPKLTPREPTSYGPCPICGAAGVSRERRLNGNDKCANGHTYPSSGAMHDAALPKPTDKLREAAQKSLRIFDWLERRGIYQDAEVKEAHDLLRAALEGKQ